MSTPGFIYILINPSLQGLVKIGKTTRHPDSRVEELSSATGVPTPFQLVYFAEFEDCDAAERSIHTVLTDRNARVAGNREFFRIAVHEAISALINLQRKSSELSSHSDKLEDISDLLNSDDSPIVRGLLADASSYLAGTDGKFYDLEKAISLYRQAADLGSKESCCSLGIIYQSYEDAFDLQKSKSILLKGAELGSIKCYAPLAVTFLSLGEQANSEKAWQKFFSEAHLINMNDLGYWGLECIKHIAIYGLKRDLLQLLLPYLKDMEKYVEISEILGISEPVASTRRTSLDLAYYVFFGTQPPNMMQGVVKWFDSSKGYGFAVGSDGQDYFLHSSNILFESSSPQEGKKVNFQGISNQDGSRLTAVNVQV